MSYAEILTENTAGLLFRDADNLSDWTTGTEWQLRCGGCQKGVWAEASVDVDGESYCRECATEMLREMAAAMSR